MKTIHAAVAACAALAMVAGCDSGGSGTVTGFAATLQGTWRDCYSNGTNDESDSYTFSGSSVEIVSFSHTTTNLTCGITGATETYRLSGTYTVGAAVTAPMTTAGIDVTAYEVDYVTSGGLRFYDLLYVDTIGRPDRLYEGDSSTGLGFSDATRPTGIDDTYYYVKQ